jgi:cysteine-rich repeat protein
MREGAAAALAALALAGAAVLGGACDVEGRMIAPPPDGGSTGGGGAGGGTVAHTTGSGHPGICGNGVAEPGEQCDGADLFGNTCETVGKGFGAGALACTASCLFDISDCKLVEGNCFDGADNDKNGLADCADPACAAACADPCATAAIYAIPEPGTVTADNGGHPATLASSCASPAGGAGIVFAVTPNNTGVLELDVVSGVDLALSVRTTCGQPSTELGCFDRFLGPGTFQRLEVPSTAGETLFVVVQGHGVADASSFDLTARSRPIACGDGFMDGAEQCDDGNLVSGDGCSATCQLEPTEVEPNGSAATANAYQSPWFGAVGPAGDVDVVSVSVVTVPASITATVRDLDGHSCAEGALEGVLEILGADGATVLAAYDAGTSDTCPGTLAAISAPGTYFVRLTASVSALSPTFPYALDVVVKDVVCGNAVLEPGEQCDDANVLSSDGCSATCQLEPTEVEPNGSAAAANPHASPWYATIAPAGDVDVVSVDVPAGAAQVAVYVGDNGDGDCAANKIVSRVDLLAPDGVTVLGTDQGTLQNYCAFLLVKNGAQAPIHAGTYYVRVAAGQANLAATFTYTLAVDVQ